jgi:hypothetical protein
MYVALYNMLTIAEANSVQNYIQRSGSKNDFPGRLGKGQIMATALNQVLWVLSFSTRIAGVLMA